LFVKFPGSDGIQDHCVGQLAMTVVLALSK